MVNRTYNQWGEYSEIRTEIMAPMAIANTVTKLDNTTTLYQGTDVIVATLQKFGTLRTDWYMQPAFELTTECGTSLNATILSNYIVFSPPFADATGTCNSTFSILQPDGTAMVPTVENNTSVFKMYNPWLDTSTYTLRIDNSNCASTSLQALAVSVNPVIDNICFNSYYCPSILSTWSPPPSKSATTPQPPPAITVFPLPAWPSSLPRLQTPVLVQPQPAPLSARLFEVPSLCMRKHRRASTI